MYYILLYQKRTASEIVPPRATASDTVQYCHHLSAYLPHHRHATRENTCRVKNTISSLVS